MADYKISAFVDEDNDGTTEILEYDLKLIQNLDSNGNIPFTGITTNEPENNQQFGFQGKTKKFPIQLVIYNHGEDMSNGTYADLDKTDARIDGTTVETIQEQIIWLEQYIHNSVFGTSWKLYGGRFSDYNGDGTDEGTPIAVEDVKIKRTAENPTRAVADIKVKVGEVV